MTDAQTIRLPEVDDDTNALVNGLLKDLRSKSLRNEMLSAYYDMHRLVRNVSNVLPPMYRSLSLTLGWTAKGVDALGRRIARLVAGAGRGRGLARVGPGGVHRALGVRLDFRRRIVGHGILHGVC